MSDFESHIKNDPLELLHQVENLMHVPKSARYPPLTLVEVLNNFLKVRQGDNESLLDYLGRFGSKVEIISRLLGRKLVDGYCE